MLGFETSCSSGLVGVEATFGCIVESSWTLEDRGGGWLMKGEEDDPEVGATWEAIFD